VRAQVEAPGGAVGYQIDGMRYDAAGNCLEAPAFAGTMETDGSPVSCDDALTYGFRGGECWQFPSSCVPDGFVVADIALIDSLCFTASECPALSCGIAAVATIDGCLSCDDAQARIDQTVTEFAQTSGYNACSNDSECVLRGWSTACSLGCYVSLGAASVQSFEAELADATAGYCADAAAWTTACGSLPNLNCAEASPLCRDGECVFSYEPPCAERPLDTCASDGDCVVAGAFPLDTDQGCFAATTLPVACVDPDLSCPPVTTPAVDGEGNCFLFGNCLPSGFERAPEGSACAVAAGTSTCAP
jgi:hypothetical protein